MDIETFNMILDDAFVMDIWLPSPRSKEFQRFSLDKWAFNEIKEYVSMGLYPYNGGTVKEYCAIVNNFMLKMSRYSEKESNVRACQIFTTAYKAAANVLDLLHGMM